MTDIPLPPHPPDSPQSPLQSLVPESQYYYIFRQLLPRRGAQRVIVARLFHVFHTLIKHHNLEHLDLSNERTATDILDALDRYTAGVLSGPVPPGLRRSSADGTAGETSSRNDPIGTDDTHRTTP